MPGLVPGIHVLRTAGQGVDGRDEPGHDVAEAAASHSWDAFFDRQARRLLIRAHPMARIDLLPDQRQRFCNISITLQCGIMKGVSCRRGAFARG
ncbi:hypothetical protein XH87_09775 [Bradyrhizobium sp. CCBAU 53415]|nr:hypothetical protein [Bradyrhizobium sp. CCBAU 53415]